MDLPLAGTYAWGTSTYIYIYIYIYAHTLIYIYIYIYIHTYIHTIQIDCQCIVWACMLMRCTCVKLCCICIVLCWYDAYSLLSLGICRSSCDSCGKCTFNMTIIILQSYRLGHNSRFWLTFKVIEFAFEIIVGELVVKSLYIYIYIYIHTYIYIYICVYIYMYIYIYIYIYIYTIVYVYNSGCSQPLFPHLERDSVGAQAFPPRETLRGVFECKYYMLFLSMYYTSFLFHSVPLWSTISISSR